MTSRAEGTKTSSSPGELSAANTGSLHAEDEARSEITSLLMAWTGGSEAARERLIELVYPRLRRLAGRKLSSSRSDISIQVTELVSETYLKLVEQNRVSWRNRAQFFAISASLMRRILSNHLRDRSRLKRGSGARRLSLDEVSGGVASVPTDEATRDELLALDQALGRLARFDALAARVVELRYFGGLSVEETATVLGVGRSTVVRSWRYARAWLREALGKLGPKEAESPAP